MSALMQTYARLPVTFSHGEGVYLYDTEGRRYLDGISGIAVNGLGHAHPAVTNAIREQAESSYTVPISIASRHRSSSAQH